MGYLGKSISFQRIIIIACFFVPVFFISCAKDKSKLDVKGFPQEVGEIFIRKCATSGCHNDASSFAAGELNLSSWEKLFQGSGSGSPVIPFRSDFSSLVYFINTYNDLGPINYPTMPVNKDALSRDEVLCIKNWIDAGAPDKSGNIAFSGNANRKKVYVANQGCKVVTVIDLETGLPMRYITVVDAADGNAIPHQVIVSPDKQYWYVVLTSGGTYLKRYKTSDDSFDSKVNLGPGNWNTMSIAPDSKTAYAIDWSNPNGQVATIDLQTMTKVVSQSFVLPDYPHGSIVSKDSNWVYVVASGGNYMYKMDVNNLNNFSYVMLDGSMLPLPSTAFKPHEVIFSPNGLRYYVTCIADKTVRVFDAATDALLNVINVDGEPQELAVSASKNLLFVSLTTSSHFTGKNGAVAIIDLTTDNLHSVTPYVFTGTQPHGMSVSESKKVVYIANRNIDVNGAPPHHSSVCGGRNGNVTMIDLNTLSLTGKKIELSDDVYSVFVRE